MNILAIETSCDETAICYLKALETPLGVDFKVEANITHTQVEHAEFGGVFPALAKREHIKNLPIILDKIMKNQDKPDVICVTNGPGLEPALWCGIVFAKELGEKWSASRRIPVVPVNHMEGHVLSVLVPADNSQFSFSNTIKFPALALLISGGHTELVLVNDIGDYKIIGKTRDDAVGEAFDKVARLLGLPYPGGPEISKLAAQFQGGEHPTFPRPMIYSKDYDFSFSGLKTAILYHTQENPTLSDTDKIAISYEFQNAVAEVLIKKTVRAIEEFGIQTLIIGGGVAANTFIITSFQEKLSVDFPHVALCTPARELTGDNALMIALAGYFKIKKAPDAVYTNIRAEGNLML